MSNPFFLENSAFSSKFRSQNFNKKYAQNAGNRISEALDFKIFQGRIPPDPPTYARFWSYESVSPHAGSAPDYIYHHNWQIEQCKDLVRVLMLGVNAHTDLPLHQANFKCYEYVFSGKIVNQGHLNL